MSGVSGNHLRTPRSLPPDGLLLRPAVTLPVELYTAARIQEFDAAEAELARATRGPEKKVSGTFSGFENGHACIATVEAVVHHSTICCSLWPTHAPEPNH